MAREAIPQPRGPAEVVSTDKGGKIDVLVGSADRRLFCYLYDYFLSFFHW